MSMDFWKGKRVLLTGHTGFKGSWMALWLTRLGATVTGMALPPATNPNLFSLARLDAVLENHFIDIRNAEAVAQVAKAAQPDIVFHLAAQALVRPSYQQPLDTFQTNVMGTAHVLDALRGLDSVRVAVMITTDKVYQNQEWPFPYRETDPLGGHDPYSASKAASERVIASYRDAFLRAQGVAVASARAGNVIGGGDWSADRLIPDAVRAWEAGVPLLVRRPDAIRPWQHVLEPLWGYFTLAQALWTQPALADAYNMGPAPQEAATVYTVIESARKAYGLGLVTYACAPDGPHETGWLSLETAKARAVLGLTPRWSLAKALEKTMLWYRHQRDGQSAQSLCEADILAFEKGVLQPTVGVQNR